MLAGLYELNTNSDYMHYIFCQTINYNDYY